MKQIIAIVKPFLVEKILEALRRAPLEAVSVAEVKGMGKQKSYLDRYADSEYAQTYLPKVEITVWVTNEQSAALRKWPGRLSKSPARVGWATGRSSCCRPCRMKPYSAES